MRTWLTALALVISPACAADAPPVQETASPAPIVFFDIAGPDISKQSAFYAAVFGWKIGPGGDLNAPVVGGPGPALSGSLRTDPADKVIYIGVDDVTTTLGNIKAHGGSVDTPRFEVPGVVILGLFRDPAGNRMGLVEMSGGKPKTPPPRAAAK